MQITAPGLACFLALVFSLNAHALYAQSNICALLLAQGLRDTEAVQISESRYSDLQGKVCSSTYDSYDKASSSGSSGGIDVTGIFGISGSGKNASSEYATKWSAFCQSSYGKAMADQEMKSLLNRANQNILNSFDRCVQIESERFIRYVQPDSGGRVFSLMFLNRRAGNPSFVVEQLTIMNEVTGARLDPTKDCDLRTKIPYNTAPNNVLNIVCHKNRDESFIVSGATSAGNIDPVKVPGVLQAPPSIESRVSALEGVTQATHRAVDLSSAVGDIVISTVPIDRFLKAHNDDGTVWKLCDGQSGTVDLRGRYPRGFDSTPRGLTPEGLGSTQEDTVGPHGHSTQGHRLEAQSGSGFVGSGFMTNSKEAPPQTGRFPTAGWEGSKETKPKTTIVNFYCRVK